MFIFSFKLISIKIFALKYDEKISKRQWRKRRSFEMIFYQVKFDIHKWKMCYIKRKIFFKCYCRKQRQTIAKNYWFFCHNCKSLTLLLEFAFRDNHLWNQWSKRRIYFDKYHSHIILFENDYRRWAIDCKIWYWRYSREFFVNFYIWRLFQQRFWLFLQLHFWAYLSLSRSSRNKRIFFLSRNRNWSLFFFEK